MNCANCLQPVPFLTTTCPHCGAPTPSLKRKRGSGGALPKPKQPRLFLIAPGPRPQQGTKRPRDEDEQDDTQGEEDPQPTPKQRKLGRAHTSVGAITPTLPAWNEGTSLPDGVPPRDSPPLQLSQQPEGEAFRDSPPEPTQPCPPEQKPPQSATDEKQKPRERVPLRVMEWNIERLGGEFLFGVPPRRPQPVIEAIARVIQLADPHLCAIIEVMSHNGESELKRILTCLNKMGKTQWDYRLAETTRETGALVTGGRTGENYAVLFQRDVGITYKSSRFAQVVTGEDASGRAPFPSSTYGAVGRLRTYRVPAEFFFEMGGPFADESGKPWTLPLILFHAPGPTAHEERQRTINTMISNLGLVESVHRWDVYPDCLICADLNADEDTRTVLPEAISYPDLELNAFCGLDARPEELESGVYLEALAEIWDAWQAYKCEHSEDGGRALRKKWMELRNEKAEVLKVAFQSLGEAAVQKVLPPPEEQEEEDDEAEFLDDDVDEDEDDVEDHKARKKKWRAVDKVLVRAIELGPSTPEESIAELAQLGTVFGERSYEAIHTLIDLSLRKGAPKKRLDAIRREFNLLFREQQGLSKVEGRQAAFHPVTSVGFGAAVTYDDSLVTTRRRSITGLRTRGARGVFLQPRRAGDLDLSNYDQVLPRSEGHLRDPKVQVLPILESVLTPVRYAQLFSSPPPPGVAGAIQIGGIAAAILSLDGPLGQLQYLVDQARNRIAEATPTLINLPPEEEGLEDDVEKEEEDEDAQAEDAQPREGTGALDADATGDADAVSIPEDRRKVLVIQLMNTALRFLKKLWGDEKKAARPLPEAARIAPFLEALLAHLPVLRAITPAQVDEWLRAVLKSIGKALSKQKADVSKLVTDALPKLLPALDDEKPTARAEKAMRALLVELAAERLQKAAVQGRARSKKPLAELLEAKVGGLSRSLAKKVREVGSRVAAEAAWDQTSTFTSAPTKPEPEELIEEVMTAALAGLVVTPANRYAINKPKLKAALIGLPGLLRESERPLLAAPPVPGNVELAIAIEALLVKLTTKPTKKGPPEATPGDVEGVLVGMRQWVEAALQAQPQPHWVATVEDALKRAAGAISEPLPAMGGETDVLGLRLALALAMLRPDAKDGYFGALLSEVLRTVLRLRNDGLLEADELAVAVKPLILWLARKADREGTVSPELRVLRAAVEVVERCLTSWDLLPEQVNDFISLQAALLQAKLISDHNPLLLEAWVYPDPSKDPLYDEEFGGALDKEEADARREACKEMRLQAASQPPLQGAHTGVTDVGAQQPPDASGDEGVPDEVLPPPPPPRDPIAELQELNALQVGDRVRFLYRVSPNIECEAVVLSAAQVPDFVLQQDGVQRPADTSGPLYANKLATRDTRARHIYVKATGMYDQETQKRYKRKAVQGVPVEDDIDLDEDQMVAEEPDVDAVGCYFALAPGRFRRV